MTGQKDGFKGERIVVLPPMVTAIERQDPLASSLYVTDSKASVVRPKKELKGFSKVALEPGETKQVSFTITPDMLSYFDADAHEWVAEAGEFVLHIASSSANIHSSLPYMYNK